MVLPEQPDDVGKGGNDKGEKMGSAGGRLPYAIEIAQ